MASFAPIRDRAFAVDPRNLRGLEWTEMELVFRRAKYGVLRSMIYEAVRSA